MIGVCVLILGVGVFDGWSRELVKPLKLKARNVLCAGLNSCRNVTFWSRCRNIQRQIRRKLLFETAAAAAAADDDDDDDEHHDDDQGDSDGDGDDYAQQQQLSTITFTHYQRNGTLAIIIELTHINIPYRTQHDT